MALIQVKLLEEVFAPAEKQQMIAKFTDIMVSLKGEAIRPVTWVMIEEVCSGEWGIGGAGTTTEVVRALASTGR